MGKQSRRQRQIDSAPTAEQPTSRTTGEPLLSPKLIRDATTIVLVALSILSWLAAHSTEAWAGAGGLVFLFSSFALGLMHPLFGLVMAIFTAPFQGGTVGSYIEIFGVSEFTRAAPIWGGVVRTLIDVVRKKNIPDAPPKLLLVAAIASTVLAPLTRLPAEAYPAYQGGAEAFIIDVLGLIGSQSVMWGAWILASHLPRTSVTIIERAIAIALPIAILVALAAYVQISEVEAFAYRAASNGRLAGLGFPTPTAMGVAIALPIAAAVAWRNSRKLGASVVAFGLLTIYLTGSRGPLIASIGSGLILFLLLRKVPKLLVGAGGVASAVAAGALGMQRYGSLIGEWLSGRSVDILGASDSTRIASWIAAFQIAIAKPLSGVGFMGLRFWDPTFDKNHVADSHNIVLVALASGGIPYGAATGVGVAGSAVMAWKNRKRVPVEWLAATTAVLICGIWDMPQTRAFASLYGGIALGLVSRNSSPAVAEDPRG